jgi:hypothetical protein
MNFDMESGGSGDDARNAGSGREWGTHVAQTQRKFEEEVAAGGDAIAWAERLRGTISTIGLTAASFVSKTNVEATVAQWLAGIPEPTDEDELIRLFGNAFLMAMALALFAPNLIGQTAIDRFARHHKAAGPDETAAIEALRRSRFRVLRLEALLPPLGFRACDLATGESLHLVDGEIPPACAGLSIAARVCPVGGGIAVTVGPVTPLDETMLDLVQQSIRPNGRGLAAQRCAEALYRHAVRYGVPQVQGLNADAPAAFPFGPEDGPLHDLAFALAQSGAKPTAAQVQRAREMSSGNGIVDAIAGIMAARRLGPESLAAAYEALALIQMETVARRAATGLSGSLDGVKAMLDRTIADGEAPPSARDVFQDLRRRVRVAAPGQKATDADLDKVLGRIQALRAKTTETGCTEQEALAAAEKVAELLDRYGLSLSEVELKDQSCEGAGVETGRKRLGPIDVCIPAVGRFCDCRVWIEKTAAGEIRYVFFGLPADVAGARYLHDLVEQAFETETDLFRSGALYAEHPPGQRRGATTSFQTGLAYGIAGKLRTLHAEREAAMRTTTGRDLVPIKAAVLDEELAKLGMTFQASGGQKAKRVLSDAYHAGQAAGDRFEYRPGIGHSG